MWLDSWLGYSLWLKVERRQLLEFNPHHFVGMGKPFGFQDIFFDPPNFTDLCFEDYLSHQLEALDMTDPETGIAKTP